MDKKQINSFQKTLSKEDDTTNDFNVRTKRRISFSGKKAVREFYKEEVAKAWNNSYELSDRAESSNNSAGKSLNSNENPSLTSSALCTTDEFVNKSLHRTICIDNSLEITLSEKEKIKIRQNVLSYQSTKEETNPVEQNKKLKYENETKTETQKKTQTIPIQVNECHIPIQTTCTNLNTAEQFLYFNDNSNKENIAPQIIEECDKESCTKSVNDKQEPSTTGSIKTHIQPSFSYNLQSKDDLASKITYPPMFSEISLNLEDCDNLTKFQPEIENMSISPTINGTSNSTAENSYEHLYFPGCLPKSSKQLDFRQLNAEMVHGRLNLFLSNKLENKNENNNTKMATTNCSLKDLHDTEYKEMFCQMDETLKKIEEIEKTTRLDFLKNTNNETHMETVGKSIAIHNTIIENTIVNKPIEENVHYHEKTAYGGVTTDISPNGVHKSIQHRRGTIVFMNDSIEQSVSSLMQTLPEKDIIPQEIDSFIVEETIKSPVKIETFINGIEKNYEEKWKLKNMEKSQYYGKRRYTSYFENDGDIEIEEEKDKEKELSKVIIENSLTNIQQIPFEIKTPSESLEIHQNLKRLQLKDHSDKNQTINEIETSFTITKPQLENVSMRLPTNKRKTVMFADSQNEIDLEITPTWASNIALKPKMYPYSPATPHRSILEFERLENEININETANDEGEEGEEEQNKTVTNEIDRSPMELNEVTRKRSTVNLTPNLPSSKKHQQSPSNYSTLNKMDIEFSINDEQEFRDNSTLKNEVKSLSNTDSNVINITDLTTGEIGNHQSFTPKQQQTPAQNLSKSRIPIYSGSGKRNRCSSISTMKSRSLFQLESSPTDTIETPRGALSCNSAKSFFPDYTLTEQTTAPEKLPEKSYFENDKPITISDVSEHFLSMKHRQTLSQQEEEKTLPILSQTTNKSKFNLVDSLLEIIESDAIEKTKFELVESLLTESCPELELEDEITKQKDISVQCDIIASTSKPQIEKTINKVITDECGTMINRKNEKCQETILNDTTSTEIVDSFDMPTMPPMPTLRLDRLEKYRKGPTLEMVRELYVRLNLDKPIEKLDMSIEDIDSDDEDEDPFFEEHRQRAKKIEEDLRREANTPPVMRDPFVRRLENLLSESNLPNWILNSQMEFQQLLRFRHRKVMTICIILQYDVKTPLAMDIVISHINCQDSSVVQRIWTPNDYIVHFQLQLEMPLDLRMFCLGNSENDVLNMLQKVDKICVETVQLAEELWGIVCDTDSKLIREANRTFVQKVVRRIITDSKGDYQKTEVIEFRIEITNIKKLSFKNITMPALHLFQERIQNLSPGLHFLQKFLDDPLQYI